MANVLYKLQNYLNMSRRADFIAPLMLRLYLFPIFWMAGTNKWNSFENTVAWFGNPEWGLGLPMPTLMAFLATSAEVIGALALLIGFGVRWMSIPLMVTMLVATFAVHWENGWQAIADKSMCLFNCDALNESAKRIERVRDILQEHGNYEWLTETGNVVISNNGIEFAATYFVMLLTLFFIGGGRYVSVDYWIKQKLTNKKQHGEKVINGTAEPAH
ncbi:HvfX family Cu-binding RiPP maturation protein [Kaarinaea lacus]